MTFALLKNTGLAALCLAGLASTAQAADVAAPETGGWSFTAAAYLWGSGIEGQAGILGLPPQDVDLSFGDLFENLDFAAMGLAEARNGPFVLGMDLTYSKVSANVDNPREGKVIIVDSLDVETTSWMVTGYGGYSLIDNGAVRLDAIAGARLWSVDTEISANSELTLVDGRSVNDGATWVDPLVGAKLRVDLASDVYAAAWGMVGGFGVGSDLMWDVMAGAGYQFTENFDVFAGYRAVSVDYSDDGFVYDMVQQGPVLAAVFRF